MRFALDDEQAMLAETLDRLLADAGTPGLIRAWARGDHVPGRELWGVLGRAGVFGLAVPERHGGSGVLPVELVVALVELGRHAVPGPVVETVAASALLDDPALLPTVADGSAVLTLAFPPTVPYALDADTADLVLAVGDREPGIALRRAEPLDHHRSLDPARRLFTWHPGPGVTTAPGAPHGYDLGVLACAAQALGLGRRLLDVTVEYARNRRQFGRAIGEFQAVQHQLADVLTGLEFARPLVYGAALAHGTAAFAPEVSAAKVAASEAAYAAARVALQVHGAIGYTDDHDVSLWIRKARALHSAWGTPSHHRGRVLRRG